MKTARSSILAMTVVTLGILAGCAEGPTTGAPPTTRPSTPAIVPSTPPPETATPDADDPSTWIISAEGAGPLRIGGDFAEILAGLPPTWENDVAHCAWMASWTAADDSYGVFVVRGPESETAPIGEVTVHTAAEHPVAVDGPVTAEGLGIGATRRDVLAAYPDAEEGAAQIGGGTWIRLAGAGEADVFFEFRQGSDTVSEVTVTTREQPSYEVCG